MYPRKLLLTGRRAAETLLPGSIRRGIRSRLAGLCSMHRRVHAGVLHYVYMQLQSTNDFDKDSQATYNCPLSITRESPASRVGFPKVENTCPNTLGIFAASFNQFLNTSSSKSWEISMRLIQLATAFGLLSYVCLPSSASRRS